MLSLQTLVIWFLSYYLIPYLTFLPPGPRTLLQLSAPYLFPKAIALIQSITNPSKNSRVPIRPTPPKVRRALNLLFVSATLALLLSLPYFSTENIFVTTQSRLQIATDVLFTRLAAARPLTPTDDALRAKFVNTESRLLYLVYGPDTLANCTICASSDDSAASAYFLYYLPKLVAPHLLHAGILGAATSSVITGPEGTRWRTHATIAGLALLVAELWYIFTYDITLNKKATRLEELDFVFWRVRTIRQITICAVDALLAAALWLTSTNRWLARPPAIAARIEGVTKNVEDSLNKMRALGVLRNALVRDKVLRAEMEEYWRQEAEVMGDVVQEVEVAGEINKVVERLDMDGVEMRAAAMADGIVEGLDRVRRV